MFSIMIDTFINTFLMGVNVNFELIITDLPVMLTA